MTLMFDHAKRLNHIDRLENLIVDGEQLRDQMRRTAEAKDTVIQKQGNELIRLRRDVARYRTSRARSAELLKDARGQITQLKSQLPKKERPVEEVRLQYDLQQHFIDEVKAVANEMGIWPELVAKVKERQNG